MYRTELKKQCVTDAEVRDDLRSNLLSNAIFKKVHHQRDRLAHRRATAYYDAHRQVYTTPQTRVVSHILVKNKALADKLDGAAAGGAELRLAGEEVLDRPWIKAARADELTITRGQTVAPFDRAAFAPETGAVCQSRCTPSTAGTSSTRTSAATPHHSHAVRAG